MAHLRALSAQREAAVKAAQALPLIEAEVRGYMVAVAVGLGVDAERVERVDLETGELVLTPETGVDLPPVSGELVSGEG